MIITSAQYVAEDGVNKTIKITIDENVMFVPLDTSNRHYVEILRQVEDGELTIADAD